MQNEPPQAAKQSGSRLCADFDLSRTCVGAWVCARMHVCLSVRLSLRACVRASRASLCVYVTVTHIVCSILFDYVFLCYVILHFATLHSITLHSATY